VEEVKGYCIDSDILIDYLRGTQSAREFLLDASKTMPLYISAINITEVYSGKETKIPTKKERVKKFLENFMVIDVDATIAEKAGELRRDHQQPFADMLIAATALEHELILITRNAKHFHGIRDLKQKTPY
jgi:predicted nucleic acid-binding protein